MQSNEFLGLVKFFRNKDFLERLIQGCFHCTPPEVYRLDKQEGVSDEFESCAFSYRLERDDSPIVLEINDQNIADILGLTVHNKTDQDSWLHCWFTLRIPKDQDDLTSLKNDLEKMKAQFGVSYAFIPASKLKPFVERLKCISEKPLYCGAVNYSGNPSEWGNLCKATNYSYQREYRFCFGECATSEKNPYIISDPAGFEEFIYNSPEIKLQSKDFSITWLELSA